MGVLEFVVLLVIASILFLGVRLLLRIERRLAEAEKPDDSVHDVLHPVFSLRQLRQTRQRFKENYTMRHRLEQQIYKSEAWARLKDRAELPTATYEDMRKVCQALVEAECSWKEYVFMISGNLAVAQRGESGRNIVEKWKALLKETRGSTDQLYAGANREKLQRVKEWYESWSNRVRDPDGRGNEPTPEPLFTDIWDEEQGFWSLDRNPSAHDMGSELRG